MEWKGLLNRTLPRDRGASEMSSDPTGDSIHEAVRKAHREWIAARQYFESVSDPDLVEYAAYRVTAAEKIYVHLLKRCQDQGEEA